MLDKITLKIFNKTGKNKVNNFNIILIIIFLLSFLVRFCGLGYSNFYGDETKVFYLDKTIPATEFFLNQRKGPIQFLIVWITEKLVGGYDELLTRLPFAFAGFLSVVVFYYIVIDLFKFFYKKNNLNDELLKSFKYISLIATLIFSFSGFNVAFSRIIQYQTFLTLFGLLGLYLYLNKRYLLSGLFFGLAFLTHYDAIFFIIPLLYFFADAFFLNFKNNFKKIDYRLFISTLSFILPFISIVSFFYIPYFIHGYFGDNSLEYLNRRILGDSQSQKNYSAFTLYFYNNGYSLYLLLSFAVGLLFIPILNSTKKYKDKFFEDENLLKSISSLAFWFISIFLVLQFFVTNPGTHIHNYLIPLYILSGIFILYLYSLIRNNIAKKVYFLILSLIFISFIFTNIFIFIPRLSNGYPYNIKEYKNIFERYQLFVYGFPYNRGWNEVRDFFISLDTRVNGVYTNDNDVIAKYYLKEFSYTVPGNNYLPEYYIHVKDNSEFLDYMPLKGGFREEIKIEDFNVLYTKVKKINDYTIIYKLN